jgi:hypothetical protein
MGLVARSIGEARRVDERSSRRRRDPGDPWSRRSLRLYSWGDRGFRRWWVEPTPTVHRVQASDDSAGRRER